MEKKTYCPFCGNPSVIDDNSELRDMNRALLEQLDKARGIDQEWFNDATSTINEFRARAEAAEARCADLLESNLEQAEAIVTLRTERDELRIKATEYDRIKELVDFYDAGNLYDQIFNMLHDDSSERYWQLTAEKERANAATQRERAETLRATVAEQARKLEEARKTMTRALELLESIYLQSSDRSATVLALRAYLAANAPQAEQAQT